MLLEFLVSEQSLFRKSTVHPDKGLEKVHQTLPVQLVSLQRITAVDSNAAIKREHF